MPTYRNGIETRDNLYRAARSLFAQKGYYNTSVKDIVKDAQSKLGLFSYYFDSKEALALEIFLDIQSEISNLLSASPLVADIKDDVMTLDMTFMRLWFTIIAANPHLARFAHELCVTEAYLEHTRKERRCIWHELYPGRNESDRDKIDYSLASGMISQFIHDLPHLELQECLQEGIDHVLTAIYSLLRFRRNAVLPISESLHLSRVIVDSLPIRISADFKVYDS